MDKKSVTIILLALIIMIPYIQTANGINNSSYYGVNALKVTTIINGTVKMIDSEGSWSISDYLKADYTITSINESFYKVSLENIDISLNNSPEALAKIFNLANESAVSNIFISTEEIKRAIMSEYKNNTILYGLYKDSISPTYKHVLEYLADNDYETLASVETYAALVTSPFALIDTYTLSGLLKYRKLVPSALLSYQIIVYDSYDLATFSALGDHIGEKNLYPRGIEVYEGIPLEHYSIKYNYSYGIGSVMGIITVRGDIYTLPFAPVFLYNPVAFKIDAVVKHYQDMKLVRTYIYHIEGYMITDYKAFLGYPNIDAYVFSSDNGSRGYSIIVSWSQDTNTDINSAGGSSNGTIEVDNINGAPIGISLYLENNTDYSIWGDFEIYDYKNYVSDTTNYLSNETSSYSYVLVSSASKLVMNTPYVNAEKIDLSKSTIDLEKLKIINKISILPQTRTTQQNTETSTETQTISENKEQITTSSENIVSNTQISASEETSSTSTEAESVTTTIQTNQLSNETNNIINNLLSNESIMIIIIIVLLVIIVVLLIAKR